LHYSHHKILETKRRKSNNMKAYPFSHRHPTTGVTTSSEGMDLRDYFAGLAMQGLLASDVVDTMEVFAVTSYQIADLLLKARSKQDE
jgi:hypothetical protein